MARIIQTEANPATARRTLAEWSAAYGVHLATFQHASGAYALPFDYPPMFPDRSQCQEATRELWRLADYAVSNVVAGSIWLYRRAR